MGLAENLADMISGFSRSKESLEEAVAAQKQYNLSTKKVDIDVYNQQRAVQESTKKFKAMTDTITQLDKSLKVAAAAGLALGVIANPTAWETLKSSLQLVAFELGQHALPVFIAVSAAAQELSRQLASLDPQTKETITQFTAIAIGAAGVVKGLDLLATKTGLVVGGFTALLFGLDRFTKWLVEKADEEAKKAGEVAGHQYTREEIAKTKEYKEIKGLEGDPEEQKRRLDAYILGLQKEMSDVRKRMARGETRGAGMFDLRSPEWFNEKQKQLDVWMAVRNAIKFQDPQNPANPNPHIPSIGRGGIAGAMDFWTGIIGGGVGALQGKGLGGILGGGAGGGPGGNQFLQHILPGMQPRFTAVEEARKQLQISALKDPLEQELIRKQREAYEKFNTDIPTWTQAANKIIGWAFGARP